MTVQNENPPPHKRRNSLVQKIQQRSFVPAGFGGFNQMAGNQQFPMQQQQFAMMQQQQFPMMQQGGMMPQGPNPMMMQQQQQAMMMQGGQMFPGVPNQVGASWTSFAFDPWTF